MRSIISRYNKVGIAALCLVAVIILVAVRFSSPIEDAEAEVNPTPNLDNQQTGVQEESQDNRPKVETVPDQKTTEEEGVNQPVETILSETEDAGQSYIDETLFIGDSNTARYMIYRYISLANGIGVVGMGAGSISSLPCVAFSDYERMVTIPEAVAIMQPRRVVFSFGTNNLMESLSGFIEEYEAGITETINAYPYFDVIVNAIPPVSSYCTYTTVSMSKVYEFNEALKEMCERNGWFYLNSTEALLDYDSGYAYSGYTDGDGLHLSQTAAEAFFDYFRTHALESKDCRPLPLHSVPEQVSSTYNPVDINPLDGGNTSDITSSGWWSGDRAEADWSNLQAETEWEGSKGNEADAFAGIVSEAQIADSDQQFSQEAERTEAEIAGNEVEVSAEQESANGVESLSSGR